MRLIGAAAAGDTARLVVTDDLLMVDGQWPMLLTGASGPATIDYHRFVSDKVGGSIGRRPLSGGPWGGTATRVEGTLS